MSPSRETSKECITVVVPVFNRPALILRSLDSLKAQTYRPLRVIVVDNASTDDTIDRVREWSRNSESESFTLEILSEHRRGAAYARQTGLLRVATDKVMFFDSDDVMRPECVSEVMGVWSRHPEADVVAWPVVIHHASGPRATHSIEGNLLERHLVHTLFRTQGYAVRTSSLLACGGWRGEFPVWNDLETGSRLLLSGPEVIEIDVPLVDVYPQAESITGTGFSGKHGKWEKSLDGIDESIDKSGHTDKERLHAVISYRRAILAAFYYREGHPELAAPLYGLALSGVAKRKRPLIRFAYHWTRLGMRGAFSIVGRFL